MRPGVLVTTALMSDSIVGALAEHFTLHRYNGPDLYAMVDPGLLDLSLAPKIRALATDPPRGATRAFMDKLPNLEIVSCYGAGVDHIDVLAAKERGIPVTNTPGVLTDDVADLAMGLVIASARNVVHADRFIRDGGWHVRPMAVGRRLTGKTLGVLGLGRIGGATAERAHAFGMRVIYNGPGRKENVSFEYFASLVEMACACDFLVVTCKGGPDTRHLVGREVLRALGTKGTLINVGRGTVVDEAGLVASLASGELGAAALDVFEDEPRISPELLTMPNVIVQPHHGSYTIEAHREIGRVVLENLLAHFAGKPLLSQVKR